MYLGSFLLLCAKVLLAGFIRACLIDLLLRRLVSSLRGCTSAHLLTRHDYALKMARVLHEHGVRGVFFDQADSRHGTACKAGSSNEQPNGL